MLIFLRSCLKYFIFAGFFSVFINALQLTFPLYMLSVYVKVLTSYNLSTLYAITTLALMALFTMGCLEMLRSRLLIRAGIKLDQLLTQRVLKDMLRDLCRVDSMQYTQGLRDVNVLRNYLGGNAIFAFFDVPWIFIYLGVIYLIHPVLGLVATGGAVVILTVGILQNLLTRNDMAEAATWKNQAGQWLSKSLRTARELQSMAMVNNVAARVSAFNDKEVTFQEQAGKTGHILQSFSQSFRIFMQVAIFGTGAILVLAQEANPGVIIAASIIMGRALAPVSQGVGAWKQSADAKSAYDNLKKLLATSEEKTSIEPADLQGALAVENLSLNIGEATVLESLNFFLNPGEILGLIGPNGAGKTSLCRIILGMWAPTKGAATLDGHDTFALDNDSIGRCLGYLPQNVELFAGSVKENIARMGEVDSEKIIEAAKRAGAHESILKFPQGYETDIGESGQSLSGGQRQRVGLARALYDQPRMVVLDEPNSNLDEEGEQALVLALQRLKEMKATTIIITHKLDLLQTVDKILFLENGTMQDFGSREEVFAKLTEKTNAIHT